MNWFLDRSLAHQNHPHFRDDEGNTWKVSSGFYDDIKNIFTGKYSQPPIAHRVRGHIRTLTEREPTDESRDNAPSYIRRHMSPSDTWVRGYNKGDENSSKQLATRLGFSVPAAKNFEMREVDEAITLASLRKIANAMEMDLVYYFKPKQDSLDDLLQIRAELKAKELMEKLPLYQLKKSVEYFNLIQQF